MDIKFLIINFVVTFVVGFVVTALTTWVWGLLFEGAAQVNWTLALALGLAIGIALTAANAIRGKQS